MERRAFFLCVLSFLIFAEGLSWMMAGGLGPCPIKPEHSQQSADNNENHDCPTFFAGTLLTFERGFEWVKRDDNDKGVVAAFTVVLAISTIGLWLATINLWKAGERQLELLGETAAAQSLDMQASVAVADRAARAAQTSADSAVAVERGRIYALIDHNFLNCIDGASAWDGPRSGENPLPMGMWPMAGIRFKNYGKTPAIIEEVGTGVEYSEGIPMPVYDVKIVNKNIIGPGDESEQFGTVITGQMTMNQAIKVKDGAANIWVYGYVIYDDIFGSRQTHRFFRRLVCASQFRYVLRSYDHKHYNQSS
jgi:hypothetical protein